VSQGLTGRSRGSGTMWQGSIQACKKMYLKQRVQQVTRTCTQQTQKHTHTHLTKRFALACAQEHPCRHPSCTRAHKQQCRHAARLAIQSISTAERPTQRPHCTAGSLQQEGACRPESCCQHMYRPTNQPAGTGLHNTHGVFMPLAASPCPAHTSTGRAGSSHPGMQHMPDTPQGVLHAHTEALR
jgi:hypothetical protein